MLNLGEAGGVVSGRMGALFRTDGVTSTQSSIPLSDGLHSVAVSWDGASIVLFSVDGIAVTPTMLILGSVTNFWSAGQKVGIATGSSAVGSSILMSGAAEGAASQGMLNQFTLNPWQLFQPRRIAFDQPALVRQLDPLTPTDGMTPRIYLGS